MVDGVGWQERCWSLVVGLEEEERGTGKLVGVAERVSEKGFERSKEAIRDSH